MMCSVIERSTWCLQLRVKWDKWPTYRTYTKYGLEGFVLGVDGVQFRFEGASRSKQTLGQCTIQECGRIRRRRNLWILDNLPGEFVCAGDSGYMMSDRLVIHYGKAESTNGKLSQTRTIFTEVKFGRVKNQWIK